VRTLPLSAQAVADLKEHPTHVFLTRRALGALSLPGRLRDCEVGSRRQFAEDCCDRLHVARGDAQRLLQEPIDELTHGHIGQAAGLRTSLREVVANDDHRVDVRGPARALCQTILQSAGGTVEASGKPG
jgi:hypothetical protein